MVPGLFRSLGGLSCFVGFWAFIFGFLAGAADATETPWLILGGLGAVVIGLGLMIIAEMPSWSR